ncbi:MAG: hypothetical protein BroJett021_35060 [Chloroflexota bacterium]|nr:MAG: hypothetical protein BroJett021_35060 [Chloroflexota bacterium]
MFGDKGKEIDAVRIKQGDYFLLPFAGSRKSRLVKAIEEHKHSGHWHVEDAYGRKTFVLLSSCKRCSPSGAMKILRLNCA